MNAVMINLMLAAFWLVFGIGLLVYEYGMQKGRLFPLPIGINAGWIALLLGAFNCYRVWMIRAYQRRLREREDDDQALRRNFDRQRAERRREEERRNEPRNPDFIFTDEPAKKEPAPPDDRIQKPDPELHN